MRPRAPWRRRGARELEQHFAGQVAFVTGGASGIGRALCEALAVLGAKVAVADRDREGATKVAESLHRLGAADTLALSLDVTDAEAFASAVATAQAALGPIDILFNNAGVGMAGAVTHVTLADWKKVIDVNVYGVIFGVDAVYPDMIRRGRGTIVNTASGAGLLPRPGMTPYAATKHAVVGLSTSLRAEARAHGVTVHAVCPGYIATSIMKNTDYRGVDGDRLAASIPVKPVTAEDCAQQVLRGVARDRGIIMVSRLLSLEWAMFRLSPRAGMWLSQLRARAFAKAESV